MKSYPYLHLPLVLIASIALTTGCVYPHHNARHSRGPSTVAKPGPPPHAPAHGRRNKGSQHDENLVFDAQLGVHVVVGMTNVYFHADRFYRLGDGRWEISARIDGGWEPLGSHPLPKGLAKKTAHSPGHGKRGKKNGRHPAKRGR